mgnify:CR=1 FL=1
MQAAVQIYCGGLVRLMADHFVLEYSLRVRLWGGSSGAEARLAAALSKDLDQVGALIDALGFRISTLDGRYPDSLVELYGLASVPPVGIIKENLIVQEEQMKNKLYNCNCTRF